MNYEWTNVTQILHLSINMCIKCVFNARYQCVKRTNYEWTNFAWFSLLNCEMLNWWCKHAQNNEILLNMNIKCWNSRFNAQGLKNYIVIIHIAILYIKSTGVSVCLSVRIVSKHCPDLCFFVFCFLFFVFFLDGFCFLWQLLFDGCIMHQVHTSNNDWLNAIKKKKQGEIQILPNLVLIWISIPI
jgi:hypothetical protein